MSMSARTYPAWRKLSNMDIAQGTGKSAHPLVFFLLKKCDVLVYTLVSPAFILC